MFTLKPAAGKSFVNREELIQELVSTLPDPEAEFGFALYGNRKFGKTSVLREVERRLKTKENLVIVYLSVWDLEVDTISEFIKTLSFSLLEEYKPYLGTKHKIKELAKVPLSVLKKIVQEMSISLKLKEEIEILLKFEEKDKEKSSFEGLFNLIEDLTKETKTRCVLMIDEFPSLVDLKIRGKAAGEQIIKKIRSLYEQTENVVLCISGSIRKTMELTALSSVSPFYRQFIIKKISPLTEKDSKLLITKNLKGGISPEALDELWRFSQGIPFYLQFIGKKIKDKKEITAEEIKKVIDDFILEEAELLFKEEHKKLSSKEKMVIVSMARNDFSKAAEIAKDTKDDISKIYRFLMYLEEKGVLVKEEEKYEFQDPIFKEWLNIKFG